MEELCDICGDVGDSDVLAQCSVCKIAREHAYCMKILRLERPVDWICEACEMGSLMSPKDVKENLPNALTPPVVEPSKVQYIAPSEVAKLSSGAKKFKSPTKSILLSRPGPSKNVSSMSSACSIKPKGAEAAPLKILPLSVIENSCSRLAGQLLPSHSSSPINLLPKQKEAQTSRDTREKKFCQVPGKQYLRKGLHTATRDFPAAQVIPPPVTENEAAQFPRKEYTFEEHPKDTVVPSSPDTEKRTGQASKIENISKDTATPSAEMEHNSKEEEVVADISLFAALRVPPPNEGFKEGLMSSDANEGALVKILPEAEEYFPIPALHPSWNGNFEILDPVFSKISGGLRAHPPAKVLRKVYEFSMKMPKVLQFRMFTRNSIWNDIFQGHCPDAHDIGLYFFSNNHESENYSFVLDVVEKLDLVLSCQIDGVELLVFPSTFLTAESQKWCGQYFLCGIFRRVNKLTVKCTSDEKLAIIPQPSKFTDEENTIEERSADEKLAIIPMPSEFTNYEETNGECNADEELAIIPYPSEFTNDEELSIIPHPSEFTYDEELAIIPHPSEFTNDEELVVIPHPSEFANDAQAPDLTNVEDTIGDEEDGSVDMEIDMEGGKPVGRVDIPVPRESFNWSHGTAIPKGDDVSDMPPSKKMNKSTVKCTSDEKLAIIPQPSKFTDEVNTIEERSADEKLAIIPMPSEFTNYEETNGECNADEELAIIPYPSEFTNDEELAIIPHPSEFTNDEELVVIPHPSEFTNDEELVVIPHPSEFANNAQAPDLTNVEDSIGDEEDCSVDMEIDMEGGKPVGRVDIPVPRESFNWSHGTAIPKGDDVSDMPPSKKMKLKLCTPPPGFEHCGPRINRSRH